MILLLYGGINQIQEIDAIETNPRFDTFIPAIDIVVSGDDPDFFSIISDPDEFEWIKPRLECLETIHEELDCRAIEACFPNCADNQAVEDAFEACVAIEQERIENECPTFGDLFEDSYPITWSISVIDRATQQVIGAPACDVNPGLYSPSFGVPEITCTFDGWETQFHVNISGENYDIDRVQIMPGANADVTVSPNANIFFISGDEIIKVDSTGRFETKWGEFGSGPGEFMSPQSLIAGRDDSIFVSDTGNHRIQKFDNDGNFLLEWGSQGSGEGQFDTPTGIAIANLVDVVGGVFSREYDVFVADTGNHRVQKFDKDGNFLLEFGTFCDKSSGLPVGDTCVDPDLVIDPDTEEFVSDGPLLSGDGQFFFPLYLDFGPVDLGIAEVRKLLLVNDGGGIQGFSILGDFVDRVPFDRSLGGADIGIYDDAQVVYTGTGFPEIVWWDSTATRFGAEGDGPERFSETIGIGVDDINAQLYVVDNGNRNLQRFNIFENIPCDFSISQLEGEKVVSPLTESILDLETVMGYDIFPGEIIHIPIVISGFSSSCLGNTVDLTVSHVVSNELDFLDITEHFFDTEEDQTTGNLNLEFTKDLSVIVDSESPVKSAEVLYKISAEMKNPQGLILKTKSDFLLIRIPGFDLGVSEPVNRLVVFNIKELAHREIVIDNLLDLKIDEDNQIIISKFCCELTNDQGPEQIEVNLFKPEPLPPGLDLEFATISEPSITCTSVQCIITLGNTMPEFTLSEFAEFDFTFDRTIPYGTYQFEFIAQSLSNGIIEFGTLTIDYKPNTDTGKNVFLEADFFKEGLFTVGVEFSEINQPGNTLVDLMLTGPSPPSGFAIQAFSGSRTYLDITTTATINGPITITIDFDGRGLTRAQEQSMKLFHFNENSGEWEDATITVDSDNDQIIGVVNSLSTFAILSPLTPTTEQIQLLIDDVDALVPDQLNSRTARALQWLLNAALSAEEGGDSDSAKKVSILELTCS